MLQRSNKGIAENKPIIEQEQQPQAITPYTMIQHDFLTHSPNRIGKRSKVTITKANQLAKQTGGAEWSIASQTIKGSMYLQNEEQVRNIFFKPTTRKLYNKILEELAPMIPSNLDEQVALKDIQDLWRVDINITDFMHECNIKDRKYARQMMREAGQALRELRWEFTISYKNNKGQRITDRRNITFANKVLTVEEPILTNSTFTFSVDSTLVLHLARHGYSMMFDTRYYKIDSQKYPQALPLASEIQYLINQRCIPDTGYIIRKATTLLKACGDLIQLADIQEAKTTDRHFADRIIEPIEKGLDHIGEVGIIGTAWEWCSKNGEPIDPALININNLDNLYVKIPVASNYPVKEHNEVRKAIEDRRAKARKKRGKK